MNKKQKEVHNLEVLKSQILSHSGVVTTVRHDIQNLKKKIADSKQGNDCLIQ